MQERRPNMPLGAALGSFRWNQTLRQNTDPDHQMTNIGGRRDLIHGEAKGRRVCPSGCLRPETVMLDLERSGKKQLLLEGRAAKCF
jgi:hypothetical protein